MSAGDQTLLAYAASPLGTVSLHKSQGLLVTSDTQQALPFVQLMKALAYALVL